ncbi:Phospholipase D-like domain [Phytophthora cactorum]|nr:Phospholipase D-like domain [Phytophthora cactorum]
MRGCSSALSALVIYTLTPSLASSFSFSSLFADDAGSGSGAKSTSQNDSSADTDTRDDINKIPASEINGAQALYIFDDRVRTMTSSHHQKSLVFAVNSSSSKTDQPIAYVGGLDFTNDRWDTIYHNNSAIRDAAGITYERKGWIDAHVRIHGPAAKDVANNFLARWNSNYLPCQGLDDDLLDYVNPTYKKLPSLDYASSNTTAKLGKQSVQIVRTFSCKYKHYKEFAPYGENSLFQARLKAIKNAKNYIYVEDQYFILVPELLDALMEVMPKIQRLIVIVNVLEFKYRATGYEKYLYDMAYPNKFDLYTIKEKLNIYIHSKMMIIDDVYLSVGSSNWNRRGMTSDSEMNANIVDTDTIKSPDGVIEMTGLSYDELDAMTLMEAFNSFEAAASDGSTILQHLEVLTTLITLRFLTSSAKMWILKTRARDLLLKVPAHRQAPAQPGLSQVKLAQWAMAAFNLERAPSANTVKKILLAAEEIEEKHRQGVTKRGRDVVSPELETALKSFVDVCNTENVRLSRKLLVQKAQEIVAGLPPERHPKLGLSVGWMTNFMARNGIRFREFRRRRVEDNSGLVDNAAVPEGQPQRTLTDVTDHLALARDTPGKQIVRVDMTMEVSPRVTELVNGPMTKTVMITGAGRGIGLAFVKHYIKEGWNVIAAVRDVDKADELKALYPWRIVPLDVADQQSIEETAKVLRGVAIDLLINNAGASGLFSLNDTTPEDCIRQFQVNALGPLLVTRALLPNLRLAVSARGFAFVAQVTSRIGSISDNSSGGAYAHRASKSLAIDLEPQKIGCLLLHPGNVSTAYNNFNGAVEPEESVEGMARLIDRAKLGDPLQLLHFGKGDIIDW